MIIEFFYEICPLLSIFSSTTESLSEIRFSPKKNYDVNGLEESVLGMMPSNSTFIIDETSMNSGKIEKHGVDNIRAIATLIE